MPIRNVICCMSLLFSVLLFPVLLYDYTYSSKINKHNKSELWFPISDYLYKKIAKTNFSEEACFVEDRILLDGIGGTYHLDSSAVGRCVTFSDAEMLRKLTYSLDWNILNVPFTILGNSTNDTLLLLTTRANCTIHKNHVRCEHYHSPSSIFFILIFCSTSLLAYLSTILSIYDFVQSVGWFQNQQR